MIQTLTQLPELLAVLDDLVRRLLSDDGVQVARELGLLVGQEFAGELTSLLEMNPLEVGYWMGKKAGPIVAGILLGLMTGGVVILWRSWGTIRTGIEALTDLAKLRGLQSAQGIKVLTEPPTGGRVMIHKEGDIEWWAPAETVPGPPPSTSSVPTLPDVLPDDVPARQLPATVPTAAGAGGLQASVAAAEGMRVAAATVLTANDPGPADGALAARRLADLAALPLTDPADIAAVARITELIPIVQQVLSSPEELAFTVGELELARALLTSPAAAPADAYLDAAIAVARLRGYEVIELRLVEGTGDVVLRDRTDDILRPLNMDAPGLVTDEDFLGEVIGSDELFVDFAALALAENGPHGALTHLIQMLSVDRRLRANGSSVDELRALLVRVDALDNAAGTDLWLGTFDSFEGIGSPETMWQLLRELLGIEPGTL